MLMYDDGVVALPQLRVNGMYIGSGDAVQVPSPSPRVNSSIFSYLRGFRKEDSDVFSPGRIIGIYVSYFWGLVICNVYIPFLCQHVHSYASSLRQHRVQ